MVSCDEELDINTNPNTPENINSRLALASAETSLVTVLGGDFMNLGGFFAQYHTQAPGASQYESIDQYNINTGYADRPWTELYAGCLNDLKYVIEQSEIDGNTGNALIATCLRAYTFQMMVDIFGDVPYFEALQGAANITPAPTPGEEVYADLLATIDAALAAYEANPVLPDVEEGDIIYFKKAIDNESIQPADKAAAAIDNWIKFANTLKLKMYIRMSYTSMADPGAVTALIAENNFIDEDASFDAFETAANKRNPFFEVQMTFLGDVNNVASNSLMQFYTENGDPRVSSVYRTNSSGNYVSIPQGSGPGQSGLAPAFSRPNITATTPVYLMTVAESNFLQAEGLIRYAGGVGAKEKYDAGVQASFNLYDAGSAAEFTGPGGAYEYNAGGSTEENVEQVIVQKWASLAYVNNMEAYIETTRTKFPRIVDEDDVNYAEGNRIISQISILPGNSVPSILYYPDNELERNPNITQHSGLTDKVWWDQK